jgi:hypothetical protein
MVLIVQQRWSRAVQKTKALGPRRDDTAYSIFGNTPAPGTWGLYDDGVPNITLGSQFYGFGGFKASHPGAGVVGAKMWCPDIVGLPASVRMRLFPGLLNAPDARLGTPVREVTISTVRGSWVEAVWSTPYPMPNDGFPVACMYQFTGADKVKYIHSPNFKPDNNNPVQSLEDPGLYLAQWNDAAPDGALFPGMMFAYPEDGPVFGTSNAAIGYGVDILVDPTAL